VIMKDGFIQQVGTPEEVFDYPSNLFVAEFIGAPKMNIVKTNLVREQGKYFVTPCGAKIEVTGEKGGLLNEKNVRGGEILLGVRPEHMKLAFERGDNTMSARLEVNEMMGSELHLHVFTEDGTRWIVRVPTIDLTQAQRASLVNGAQVYITFEGKVMHFFDPKTEKNLIY
ncbi:MAG: ABC transporter ATP-binding protein, partial [Clostridia bacterium]|nr:ABC transporter ATP-binding protein [Clostridia bacterium]